MGFSIFYSYLVRALYLLFQPFPFTATYSKGSLGSALWSSGGIGILL